MREMKGNKEADRLCITSTTVVCTWVSIESRRRIEREIYRNERAMTWSLLGTVEQARRPHFTTRYVLRVSTS